MTPLSCRHEDGGQATPVGAVRMGREAPSWGAAAERASRRERDVTKAKT